MSRKLLLTAMSCVLLMSGCKGTGDGAQSVSSVKAPPSAGAHAPAQSKPQSAPQSEADSSDSGIHYMKPPKFNRIFDRVVLVGDSRVYELARDVLGLAPNEDGRELFAGNDDGDFFIGAIGEGCDWLYKNTDRIEEQITDNCALIVNMGVNGAPSYHKEIAEWCNEAAEKFADRGVKVFFMSVNPINTELSEKLGYIINNDDVAAFNKSIKSELKNVTYIDTYSFIIEDVLGPDCGTTDGLHYEDYVYRKLMEFTWKEAVWKQEAPAEE